MHTGHRERMRNRYLKAGISAFADHEIIEFLLGYAIPRKDVNLLAHELLKSFGSLSDVFSSNVLDFIQLDGIGEKTAILISFIGDLHKLLSINSMGIRPSLSNSMLASKYCIKLLQGKKNEFLYALFLDNQQCLIKAEFLSEGTHNAITIEPSRVVKAALMQSAAFVILCHNHPGGSLVPSPEDILFTQSVKQGLGFVGITFAEHIIVAGQNAYAMNIGKEYYSPEHFASNNINTGTTTNIVHDTNSLSNPVEIVNAIKALDAAQTGAVIAMLKDL